MNPYKAAAIQMNSQTEISYNLEQAHFLIRKASEQGARLIGLPENFAFLGDLEVRLDMAGEISEKASSFLKSCAREFDIYLLGGSFPVPAGNGKTYNRSILLDPDGNELAIYDKIHLFDVDLPDGESYRESDFVKSGQKSAAFYKSEEIGTIGLSICYDLRFPELYRLLMNEKCDLLCVPSAFTATTGRDHWELLLRTRAIENTAYVFAPAQTGLHGKKRKTYGHSMIIDPWGYVVAEVDIKTGFAIKEINPKRIKEVRTRIPSLKHRVI
ncbi:MAG: carbon-nitrogen hydrolase family protein [Balneolaceae bacterium]